MCAQTSSNSDLQAEIGLNFIKNFVYLLFSPSFQGNRQTIGKEAEDHTEGKQKVQISSQSADRDPGRQPSRGASAPDPHPQAAHDQRRAQQPPLRQPPRLPRQVTGAARGRVRRGQETHPGQCQPRGGAGEAHPGQAKDLAA
ncbi:hypothetical protein Nmel_016021 [Mimus melanotis]